MESLIQQNEVKVSGEPTYSRGIDAQFSGQDEEGPSQLTLQTSRGCGGGGGGRFSEQTDSRSQSPLESDRDTDATLLFWEVDSSEERWKWLWRRRKWNKQH
ncbi:hypothetical protein D9C73_020231 [Collichthys lucidus]|uniref:Uncharacterized protein n=1 Tax=Collichthys lucidus TaxID=240159 RepID=A0A4U5VDD8_COLLU|nr:hypothetical protein D9C73_020231 [Collichthys lucidus]